MSKPTPRPSERPRPTANRRAAELGTAPLGRLLWRLSLPSAVGFLVMSLYNVVDTFWVSRLPDGPQAIAALTVVFPLQMIAAALGTGTAVGVASLVSRRYGEQKVEEVNHVAGHAVLLPLVSGSLLMLIARGAPSLLLNLFGAQPDIAEAARIYLTSVAFGFPFVLFLMTVNGLYRGAGNTVAPMVVMSGSAICNLILDPVMIFGYGPFPALGIQGAALATVISQVTAFVGSALYLVSARSGYHVRLEHFRPSGRILRDIAQVGAPAAAMTVVQSVVVSVYNGVLGAYGSTAIAAYGLTFRVLMVLIPWIMGLNQGLLPIAGFSFGAGRYRRMWSALKLAAGWATGIGLVLSSLLLLLAPQVVAIFSDDPRMLELGTLSIRIILCTMWLMAPQVIGVAMLQGMGLGTQAMFLALSRQVIFLIPLILLLSHTFGLLGAYAAMPVSDTLSFLVTFGYLTTLHRRYQAPAEDPAVVAA